MYLLRKTGVALGLVAFLALLGAAFLWAWKDSADLPADEPLAVFFLATLSGADCTLLKKGNAAILVDAGEERDVPAILAFLQEQQVEALDYLVLTHLDGTRAGGAPTLLGSIRTGRIIQPYCSKENADAETLSRLAGQLRIPVTYPTRPRSFTCAGMRMTVYPPLERRYRQDNNYALAVLLRHGAVRLAFAGEAGEKRLCELMQVHWPPIDLYQIANHGRASLSAGDFIERLRPKYGVCTAAGSDEAVGRACEAVGAEVLYIGEGTLRFCSDGTTLTYLGAQGAQRKEGEEYGDKNPFKP